jgi:hypothetical protein
MRETPTYRSGFCVMGRSLLPFIDRLPAVSARVFGASDGICGPYHSPAEKSKIFPEQC